MPVVDGVDIPPPPGGHRQDPAWGPRRRPHGQAPARAGGHPPPNRRVRHPGGGPRGGGELLTVVGGALLVCFVVWVGISVVRGAVGAVATLGGATIEAASAASAAVSERIKGVGSSVSAAVPPNPFPREVRSAQPIQPDTRLVAPAQQDVVPAPSRPSRLRGASAGYADGSVSPGSGTTEVAAVLPAPPEVSSLRSDRPVGTTSEADWNAQVSQVRQEYEIARIDLEAGRYRAAHARTEQILHGIMSREPGEALPSSPGDLGLKGGQLLARIERACQAERSVLLTRGEIAPPCPE